MTSRSEIWKTYQQNTANRCYPTHGAYSYNENCIKQSENVMTDELIIHMMRVDTGHARPISFLPFNFSANGRKLLIALRIFALISANGTLKI